MRHINLNDLSSALCDMADITAKTKPIWHEPKDGEGSIYTVKDCLDAVTHFLESLNVPDEENTKNMEE